MEAVNTNENIEITDIRLMRPFAVFEKPTLLRVTCQQSESIEINKCRVSFFTPNGVSLFLSISDKEMLKAIGIYKLLFDKKLQPNGTYKISENELPMLFDYFEIIQSSIIAMYTAVEAFANIAIPDDHLEEKINNKGVKETWDKTAIEKWYSTSEKIGDLLPKILKIESPKAMPFWSNFKRLEQIRNDIIHPKISKKHLNQIESSFLEKLLQDDIFELIKCGYQLIKYYCDKDETHSYYPIGLGNTLIKPVEVEKFSDYFEILERE